eukprot:SAG11_NODE_12049_length_724_cov_1.404800_1_plen_153_part_01
MVSTEENPLHVATDIETGLNDGTMTSEQAIVAMERQLAALQSDLSVRAQSTLDDVAPLEIAIRAPLARLSEAPPNYHQYLVYECACSSGLAEDPRPQLLRMVMSAFLMVATQITITISLAITTILPSCANSDQCGAGRYCVIGFACGRCGYCG